MKATFSVNGAQVLRSAGNSPVEDGRHLVRADAPFSGIALAFHVTVAEARHWADEWARITTEIEEAEQGS